MAEKCTVLMSGLLDLRKRNILVPDDLMKL